MVGFLPALLLADPGSMMGGGNFSPGRLEQARQRFGVPTPRGQVLSMVCQLTAGMHFTDLDPKRSGTFVLASDHQILWVWQNRQGWTDRPGRVFELKNIPAGSERIEVYGFDGLRAVVEVKGQSDLQISGLAPEQTYLLVARPPRPLVYETPRP